MDEAAWEATRRCYVDYCGTYRSPSARSDFARFAPGDGQQAPPSPPPASLYPLDYPEQVSDLRQLLYRVETALACGTVILSALILNRSPDVQRVAEFLREAVRLGEWLQEQLHTDLIRRRARGHFKDIEFREQPYPHGLALCLDVARQ